LFFNFLVDWFSFETDRFHIQMLFHDRLILNIGNILKKILHVLILDNFFFRYKFHKIMHLVILDAMLTSQMLYQLNLFTALFFTKFTREWSDSCVNQLVGS